MNRHHFTRTLLRTASLALSLACADAALAQRQVNGSGATLFVDFFRDQRHANEFLDWDGDGTISIDIDLNGTPDDRDDMAANSPNPGFLDSAFMIHQYRSVGSVEGLEEFIAFQCTGDLPEVVTSERGIINRLDFAVLGVVTWAGSPGSCTDDTDADLIPNASGTPLCPLSIDFANVDVPTLLSTLGPGSAVPFNWSGLPGTTGYGRNTALSLGDPTQTGQSNLLANILCLNTHADSPDANTVYDHTISWSPICYIANRGTGLDIDRNGVEDGAIRHSDILYLYVTGRMSSGENFNVATRDVGSGTRNGIMNSSGIDPSYGVGDHVGKRINQSVPAPQFPVPRAWTRIGPYHQHNNCGGSGIMEDAVRDGRLVIGYTGVAGPGRAVADARAGLYEILGVVRDVDFDGDATVGNPANPTHRVRPTLNAILHNGDERTGWQLGGIQTFVTRGHPAATPYDLNDDGTLDQIDLNLDGTIDPNPIDPAAGTPMDSDLTAAYVYNILASIDSFDSNPSGPENARSPADFLARSFFLVSSIDEIPENHTPHIPEPNSKLDPVVQVFTAANSFLVANPTPSYGSVNNGQIPRRIANPDFNADGTSDAYSDGSTSGQYRFRNAGGLATAPATGTLSARNRLTGDFNRDGRRDINDIPKMLEAFANQNPALPTYFENGTNWGGSPGSLGGDFVIVSVIGDFNNDGNFDAADIRYFADGLAIDPASGLLNRREAFRRIDNAWNTLPGGDNNFFNTVWADSRTYQPGDSAFDVAGAAYVTPGAAPTGSDGVIDSRDNDYILAQRQAGDLNGDCVASWANINEAVRFDLSADTNGDLVVSIDDLYPALAACEPCDTDCNGTVNPFDIQSFLEVLSGSGCPCSPCAGDTDRNGTINPFDINNFIACLS